MDFNIEKNSDKEYVLGQVRQQGKILDLASEDFKKDKEVVLEAVKNDPEALEFASVELKGDKEIVLESVKKVGWTHLIHRSTHAFWKTFIIQRCRDSSMTHSFLMYPMIDFFC